MPQSRGQRRGAVRIVRPVQNERRTLRHELKAAGPARGGKTRAYAFAVKPEKTGGQDRRGGVFELVRPEKGNMQRRPVAEAEILSGQRVGEDADVLRFDRMERRVQFGAARPDGSERLRKLRRADDGAAGLYDAGLFAGDAVKGAAENGRVVKADRHDHGCLRRPDHIRRVKTAAEAALQDHDVAALFGKIQKGERRDKLEKAQRRQLFRRRGDACGEARRVAGGDADAVDLYPLGKINKIGGGIQPGPPSGAAAYGGQHGRAASLAVGAGDVNEAERILRIAERTAQRPHTRKRRRVGEFSRRLIQADGIFIHHTPDYSTEGKVF